MSLLKDETKQKAKHELKEMLVLFCYLAFFFCALTAYDMFLLERYDIEYLAFGFALINALVITKVIMIGEYAKLGKRHEDKQLWISIIWKAFIFGLLVFAFHVVEEVIKRLIHGADVSAASRDIRLHNFAARSIVIFCVFLPLFAFREFRRVLGDEEFQGLLLDQGNRPTQTGPR
jgi:hypothetical protein